MAPQKQIAYIRRTMLDAEPPPAHEQGLAKWARENLFSTPLNGIMTILGLLVIAWLVTTAFPWFRYSVWNAGSLTECRAIVAEMGGESGACWAVIKARWHQYIFGFYPQTQYWRPVLTAGLLLVALAPILFWNDRKGAIMVAGAGLLTLLVLVLLSAPATVILIALLLFGAMFGIAHFHPTKLFVGTLLFPFVAFGLLWGGPIWRPLATLAGFAVIPLAYGLLKHRVSNGLATTLAIVAAFVVWYVTLGNWIAVTGPDGQPVLSRGLPVKTSLVATIAKEWPLGLSAVSSDQFGGFLVSFVIGVTAIAASLPLGILLALGRRSDMFLIQKLSVGFIEFIRGVPLITLLFTASLLLQYFLPPQTNFDLILRVIILATLFSAAYLAEVIRGGLAALPRGQYEAADALGLDYWQAQRLIIMPQALKISIPGIVSTFIGLFKDTTLVSFVGILDPLRGVTMAVRADMNWKGIYWEPYIFVAAIFFLICFGMLRYSMYLERKLKTDHR